MPQKRYRPEEIIAKLREAEVLLGQGKKVPEVVKVLGISEVSCYRWRQEYGGLSLSHAKRLKDLERENARLRRAVSDLNLDKVILQEAALETSEPLTSTSLHRGSL
jgi:transposase-like protein